MNKFVLTSLVATAACMLAAAGCEDKKSPPPAVPAPATPKPATDSGGATAPKPAADAHSDHDHGPTTELGSLKVGEFDVKASRDGDVTEGGDVPVDLWISPTAGATAKVAAVRAWIGAADGAGSMKAKLELERDNYHNHLEVPKPLPAGAALWVEIEDDKGAKATGWFDLKK